MSSATASTDRRRSASACRPGSRRASCRWIWRRRAAATVEYALTTQEPVATLHRLTGWALERSVELEGLEVTRPTLEDIYLELTAASESERDPS